MEETKGLVNTMVEALQEKKGQRIVCLDLTKLEGSICQYFIIAQGNTPTQVSALSDSVWDLVSSRLHEKPLGAIGMKEAQWIAMDYGTVMLHIFVPAIREYYNLENLWADADVTEIPDSI
ncbi:MAG: Ribosomal silencing factor RsfS [Candidatus Ordinivivax streblomastigis]|jgi:ribosome-associated protein|uniref:Ribosomal silencing factor RsfS n=1 Tax=Candidatus Ordinivivax streblomastigis TaxID=2540710 RepID=A0A5M8P1L2_9BACT|nr:MAG: Ribosomal silencing factor RsfS [Candidatus Ordinivivax streblomastigis]MDR2844157.1 ribosome silencing factor [Candidatus Symbiothrix sp.]